MKVRNKKIDGRFYTDEYIDKLVKKIYELEDRIDKAIEILKLCNSKCSKETIDILRGVNNDK